MRLFLLIVVFVASSGCSLLKSRYAMDDEVYAAKYGEGAERFDFLGKAKQMLDARHVDGLGGKYVSGGGQYQSEADRAFVGAELGVEGYPDNWISGRYSLAGYIGDNEGYAGLDAGVRIQTPTRVAPFVGIGIFNGYSRGRELADNDFRDNDDDGFIDEPGEEKTGIDDWLSAVYPEVGMHAWLNGSMRLTAFGRYFVTTEGRARDDWLIGGQVAIFSR